jgi:hypothetical protein
MSFLRKPLLADGLFGFYHLLRHLGICRTYGDDLNVDRYIASVSCEATGDTAPIDSPDARLQFLPGKPGKIG